VKRNLEKLSDRKNSSEFRRMNQGLCAVFCLFFAIVAVSAYSAFEDVELGARPLGMGSAYVSVVDDAGAIFWNPAGIAEVDRRELIMSYMELYDLVSYNSISYAQLIKGVPVGFGLVSSSDADGVYRELEFVLSSARNIHNNLRVGSNIKYLSATAYTGDIKIGNGNGLSLDIGCQYNLLVGAIHELPLLSFGITLQNLLGYVSYDRKAVMDIPGRKYSQRPGFSYKVGADVKLERLLPRMKNSVLAVEVSDGDVHIGAEYLFRDFAAVRSGFRTGNALTRSITVGFGIKLSAIRFDYAYVGSAVDAQTSQFSVSINW